MKPTFGVRIKKTLTGAASVARLDERAKNASQDQSDVFGTHRYSQETATILEEKEEADPKEPSQLSRTPEPFEASRVLSRHSKLSKEQLQEKEAWGRSKDGYIAGGNFEDDPNLKRYTIKTYQ